MELYNYLVEKYGYNEAILLKEIGFNDYSLSWIKKTVAGLCEEGKLLRFEKGVYYIPTETILGKSKLDPRKVIVKKYINNGNNIIGYFSGVTFMNMLGLSAQMPNRMELYTNIECSKVREVPIGSWKILLRRARAKVTTDNAATMSLLELMNFTNSSFYDDEKRKIVADYIEKNYITRTSVSKYAPYFPDKAMRTLVESEIVYEIAR